MEKLHLIRHGATEAYEKRLYYGSTDVPLSENGLLLLDKYKLEGKYPSPENCRIVTSGMLRTEQTLAAIYGEAEHLVIPELAEMRFGDFEMHSYNDLKDDPAFLEWCSGDNMANVCPGGGESGNIFAARVRGATAELLKSPVDTIAVVHGGVIWAIMSMLFPESEMSIYSWQPVCGKGYTITFKDGVPDTYFPIP